MKQLSSLTFSGKQFTIQTEIVTKPQYSIRSLVYYTGKVLMKKETPISQDLARNILESMVEKQHIAVEGDVRERMNSLADKK